jgi:hypothetical protein
MELPLTAGHCYRGGLVAATSSVEDTIARTGITTTAFDLRFLERLPAADGFNTTLHSWWNQCTHTTLSLRSNGYLLVADAGKIC